MLLPHVRYLALAGSLLAAAAHGQTGLVVMPIADTLKHREATFGIAISGTERNVSKRHDYENSLTVGLFDRLEVGYAQDFMDSFKANVKLRLFEDSERLPNTALSVGVSNWEGGSADPYVVGRYDGRGYRLHGGYWHTMDADRAMLGTDFPVGASLTGSLEFLSGRGGATWASLTYAFAIAPGLELGLAFGLPTVRSEGLQHVMTLDYFLKI